MASATFEVVGNGEGAFDASSIAPPVVRAPGGRTSSSPA